MITSRSAELLSNWRYFCNSLGLSEHQMSGIEYHHTGPRMRCQQALALWKDSGDVTVEMLLHHIRTSGSQQLAGKYSFNAKNA